MVHPAQSALAATAALRQSPGYRGLLPGERARLDRDLQRIESALRHEPASERRYGRRGSATTRAPNHGTRNRGTRNRGTRPSSALAAVLSARPFETPADMRGIGVPARGEPPPTEQAPESPAGFPGFGPFGPQPPAEEEPERPQTATEVLGERAQRVLNAVDFPTFVASLIGGTFTAIVDATAQQVREYARLVADLSKSVDDFTRDRVTNDQARDFLHSRHGRDLRLVVPAPGENASPRLEPRDSGEESPQWLSEYGMDGATLTPELVEGELLTAGKRALGEDRMRTLATMVLMGINRIVVDNGELRARLQFHARGRERTSAEVVGQVGGQQMGIAGRSNAMQSAVSTMVSTVDVNTQSDVSIKTDLVGEVAVRFRTETFDLQNFADTPAIALINRHALQRQAAEAPAGATPPAAVPPVTTTPGTPGSTDEGGAT